MTDATARLGAALADRYLIERAIGEGGMATVYLARDRKHDRDVALKVLRPELAAVLGVERFLAEIKITARLDHPHILTLIDSGAADGFLYYVLPYVRGESLRDRLAREKQLGLDEALAITRQVAGALEYAHARGVIHRDIKPENILLHEGEAVLTDFGIALAVTEAGGNRLTETGLSLGTPQYMSPEQATGDRTLDARSDVYSLGAVLYEMLAGEPPVTGANVQAMIAKLMTERPTRLRVVRDTVPEKIDAAVAKALSKVPADRYRHAVDFAAALAAGSAPVPAGVRRRTLVWLGAAAASVVLGGVFAVLAHDRAPAAYASPFATSVPVRVTATGHADEGLLSPDGSLAAYTETRCDSAAACRGDLVIHETDGEGVSTIVSQPGRTVRPLGWSPDMRWVLFGLLDVQSLSVEGTYIVGQRGGSPRRLPGRGAALGVFVAADTLVLAPVEEFGVGPHTVWLRRIVANTGQVVDSVPLHVRGRVVRAAASPDGGRIALLLAASPRDTMPLLSIFDRTGRHLDSLPVPRRNQSMGVEFAWTRDPGGLILGIPPNGGGLVIVRRRFDARGHFLPVVDTLKAVASTASLAGASADGRAILLDIAVPGARRFWTATRAAPSAPFRRVREIGSSTGQYWANMTGSGRWITILRGTVPGGAQRQVSLEAFDGGAERVIVAAVNGLGGFSEDPAGDSMMISATSSPRRSTLTAYSVSGAAPVQRGQVAGPLGDLEWLADGRLAAPVNGGRAIRVIDADGAASDIVVPDSLGQAQAIGRSPDGAALAVTSFGFTQAVGRTVISRLDLRDARFTVVARAPVFPVGDVWWNSDGWIRFSAARVGADHPHLFRVRDTGGAIELDPGDRVGPGAHVSSLSRDGRRAVVTAQDASTDLWIVRASSPSSGHPN